jgi:hypothetical protein
MFPKEKSAPNFAGTIIITGSKVKEIAKMKTPMPKNKANYFQF